MADELKIVELRELLQVDLTIPNYQRPYRWSKESVATLFNDLYSNFKDNVHEYRMGAVVLNYDEKKIEYNIVDGQQRLTTISILLYCFYKQNNCDPQDGCLPRLLAKKDAFSDLSCNAICSSYLILRKKLEEVPEQERKSFIDYVLDKCTFVKIVTRSEQEAFQFFDSQNSRGKVLAPHDLLKSYHLREMNDDSVDSKIKIITGWENTNQKNLSIFFEVHLYPLVRYYKNESGLYYSSKKIKTFKGISQKSLYHFSQYHKAANLYIEHFNTEGMYELCHGKKIAQFQLTQPLIAGKRFFQYTLYYYNLCEKVKSRIAAKYSESEISTYGSGNTYVRNLFINILIFFVDKFNFDELTDPRIDFFYQWAYSLRLVMHSVYPETIDKYALGRHERANCGINLFKEIDALQSPAEMDSVILDHIPETSLQKYKTIRYDDLRKKIFGGNN